MNLEAVLCTFKDRIREKTEEFFQRGKEAEEPRYFIEHYLDFLQVLIPVGRAFIDEYASQLTREERLAFATELQRITEGELELLKERFERYRDPAPEKKI